MIKKSILFFLILFTLITTGLYTRHLLLTASIFPWQKNSPIQEEIKIGMLPIEDNLPLWFAQEKGYLSEKKLAVRFISFNNALEMNKALKSGQVNAVVGDLLGAALLEEEGAEIKVVSLVLGQKSQDGRFALLTTPNCELRSRSQLKNIPVALANNSLSEYVADKLLQDHLAFDERKEIFIRPLNVRYRMLLEGKIKAAILPDPLASSAQKEGAILLADDTKGENISQSYFYLRKEFAQEHRQEIKKLLQGYKKAVQEINNHPEKAKNILIKKGIIPSNLAQIYQISRFSFPQSPNRANIENILSWMKEKGLISDTITYDCLVEKGFLEKRKLLKFGE